MTNDGRALSAIDKAQSTLELCRVVGMEKCRIPINTLEQILSTIRDLQRQVSELTQYSRSLEHDAERAGIAAMYAEIERDDYKAALHTAKFDIETGNVDVAKFVIDSVLAKHAPRQEDAK